MSLLQCLPYQVYNDLIQRTDGWAFKVAELKKLRNVPETDTAKYVINALDRRGYSLPKFYKLLDDCQVTRQYDVGHFSKVKIKESSATLKVAILIGNNNYENWSNLVTPITDCHVLGEILKSMDFIVIILENVNSEHFRKSIENLCSVVPSTSYLFIYFAGHGFELCGAKYMLGTECPSEKYTIQNGVSENFITKHAFGCRPDLFILLLDMCRKPPDRNLNPEIYLNIPPLEEFQHICNLIVGYATSPYMPSYEKLCCQSTMSQSQHISCDNSCSIKLEPTSSDESSTFVDSEEFDIKPPLKLEHDKHMTGVSLYISHLTRHLKKDEDFMRILEMVHRDFANEQCEQALLQKPQKLDNVSAAFYLTHRSKGDPDSERKIDKEVKNLQACGVCIRRL